MFGIPDPYTPLIKIGAVVLLAGAVALGIHEAFSRYNEAIVAKAQADGKIASLKRSNDDIQAMLDEADQLAKDAQRAEAKRRAERDQAMRDLADLKRSDPNVKSWLDQPIPDAVVRMRRTRDISGSGSLPRANGAASTDPGTTKRIAH